MPAGAAAALRAGTRTHAATVTEPTGASKDGKSGGSRLSASAKSPKDDHVANSLKNGVGKPHVNNTHHSADITGTGSSRTSTDSPSAVKAAIDGARVAASPVPEKAAASVGVTALEDATSGGDSAEGAGSDAEKTALTAASDEAVKAVVEAEKIETAMRVLKLAVPCKNLFSCYLLGPVVFGECRTDRLCLPWMNILLLVIDVSVFTGHVLLAIKRSAYRDHILAYNFYILGVFWSIWNLCSHPLSRQYVDLFVAPPELHVTINIVAIAVCSSAIMAAPSMRHLIGLVTWEFLISLVLSSVEVMNFTMDTGWLSVVRLDTATANQVMFNVAILLIGSTIILGTMTVEKDIKNLASEMEHRLTPGSSFEDDLERRKRAVLTALCDAVLTTNASFVIIGSDEGADKIFRRSMLNEQFGDCFKDLIEKERFFASVKKQFPDDGSDGEGPKRMRVHLRDNDDEMFEADVVVSDASTDKHGKVNKYMVGMHIRGESRARILDQNKDRRAIVGGSGDKRQSASGSDVGTVNGGNHGSNDRRGGTASSSTAAVDQAGEERAQQHLYDDLVHEIFYAFEEVLQLPNAKPPPHPPDSCSAAEKPTDGQPDPGFPRFHLRRATCEVFRRRGSSSLAGRVGTGERHVDLRRLSLPEPTSGLN